VFPGKKFTPEDIVAIVWRRKWLIVLPFVLVSAGTFLWVRTLPALYRSEAVLVVVPQRVPEAYVRSTVTTLVEDQLPTLRQLILSRSRLEAMIQEFGIYTELRARIPMEDVVARLQRDISVETIRPMRAPTRGSAAPEAFRIAVTSTDPRLAQRVADRLSSQFSEENLRDRASQAQQTTEFLKAQLDDARRALQEREKLLADYQRRHAGELPNERDSAIQVLSSTQMQLQANEEAQNQDRSRRLFLERQIADLESDAVAAPSVPAVSPPGSDPTNLAGVSAAERLESAKAQLRALELRLKPEHPDVVTAKRVIRDLEAKVQAEELQKPLAAGAPAERPLTPDESARRNRLRDYRAELQSLDLQMQTRAREARRLTDLVNATQRRMAVMPTRESELTALTRDYQTTWNTYQSLLQRQQDAAVATNLEERQIGQQFRLIEPPRVPERPFSPDRQRLNLFGAAAGLFLGLGLAALLEYRDSAFRTESDIITALSLPVLAVVPRLWTASDRRRQRHRRRLATLALAVGVLLLVVAAVTWRLSVLRGWV